MKEVVFLMLRKCKTFSPVQAGENIYLKFNFQNQNLLLSINLFVFQSNEYQHFQ